MPTCQRPQRESKAEISSCASLCFTWYLELFHTVGLASLNEDDRVNWPNGPSSTIRAERAKASERGDMTHCRANGRLSYRDYFKTNEIAMLTLGWRAVLTEVSESSILTNPSVIP